MTAQVISKLRKSNHMTQAEMADIFQVSRQSIQKWESGVSVPDIEKLVEISRCFDVSLDYLVCGTDRRDTEELRHSVRLYPAFRQLHEWENYSANMEIEYRQNWEEGKDVGYLQQLCTEISQLPSSSDRDRLADVLFNMFLNAPQREDYAYYEPSDYATISRVCRHNPPVPVKRTEHLKEKIRGAWLGRICGCLLGKPLECMHLDELVPLLKETGNYPMHRYVLRSELTEDICQKYTFNLRKDCYPDQIFEAPADDDTNYVVLAYKLVERFGRDFTSQNVAEMWVDSQPKNAYCTAERVAFRNFVAGYFPPDSAVYKNPYREWIGAQIRGDYFGYINPGNPQAAAEMAWRDAAISHVKNGIYGEMWVAAMLAQAAVCDDMEQIIEAGLNEIPHTSRLYEQIQSVIERYRTGCSFEDAMGMIYAKFDDQNGHDWCHTISNAMIVTAALLYGESDFSKSVGLAVQSGFDTDCNGATVGSIVGMKIGASGIPACWTDPIHNRLQTGVFGVGTVCVDDMVEQTMAAMDI